jgi:hypothetical protein
MRYLISVTLVIAGIIHVLPLSGVLGSARLAALYGITFDEPNLAILMRHRAVLFGLLGVFMIVAAFKAKYQPLAFAAGFISVVSFLWLAWSADGYNAQVSRVVTADVVALVCLVVGVAAWAYGRRALN